MDLTEQSNIPTILPTGKNFVPGKGVKVRCTVPRGSSRFTIALCCGHEIRTQTDVALFVSFNMSSNSTTFNFKTDGNWGKDSTLPSIPFDYDDNLEITIVCELSFYKIFVNGRPFYDFPQSVPYALITYLEVAGGVVIEQILFENLQVFIPNMVLRTTSYVSNDLTVPLHSSSRCDWERSKRTKRKLYAIYISIAVIIIIIILCGVFIPRASNKHEFDYD